MELDPVYSIPKEISKDAFLRQVLIEIAKRGDTPIDIVDAHFSEVRESEKDALLCTAMVEGTCTASIGYDRQEPYIAYEKYKQKVGDTYVEKERPVTKYKTVTDWQLFSTEYCERVSAAVCNENEGGLDHLASKAMASSKGDIIKNEENVVVDENALKRAVRNCKMSGEIRGVSFPGDRQKDKKFHSTTEIETLTCYRLPFYEVTFTYAGEEYQAWGFACGKVNVECSGVPKSDFDVAKETKAKTALLKAKAKSAWLIFWGAVAIAFAACFIKFYWLWPVTIGALGYAIYSNRTYNNRFKEVSEYLSKNFGDAKLDALRTALKKKNLEPLGDGENCDIKTKKIDYSDKPAGYGGKIALGCILVIALIITAMTMRSNKMHSADQIELTVVSKETYYDPDARGYINGCYYIDIGYEVEAKRVGITYVEFKAHVLDKSGNELGVIRSTLSNLDVEPGEEAVIEIGLSENQPERNEFFTQLYNVDLSELQFQYEIGTIRFSDGKYYSNDEYSMFN